MQNSEFGASLVYRVTSSTARTVETVPPPPNHQSYTQSFSTLRKLRTGAKFELYFTNKHNKGNFE